MGKLSLLILLSGAFLSSNAQLNSSFEQWVSKGAYDEPKDWITRNLDADSAAKQGCRKSGAAHWGNYCLEMSPYINGSDTQAVSVSQSFPVNKKLNSISFYYRYKGPLLDPAFLAALFFNGSVEIGECFTYLTPNSSWTQAKVNVKWTGNGIPNSVSLFISTSQSFFIDTLFLDDIEMSEFGMGIDDNPVLQPLLSLNGQRQLLLHHVNDNANCRIVLRNALGMDVMDISSMNEPVELDFLPSGVYFYEMILDSGRFIGKVVL